MSNTNGTMNTNLGNVQIDKDVIANMPVPLPWSVSVLLVWLQLT